MNIAKVKGIRAELGFNQTQMAEALGMPLITYSKKERGENEFSIDNLKAIMSLATAHNIKVTIEELIA